MLQKKYCHRRDANKGKTLSEKTKTIMSDAAKKIYHSGRFKPGYKPSEKTKQNKISDTMPISIKIEVRRSR